MRQDDLTRSRRINCLRLTHSGYSASCARLNWVLQGLFTGVVTVPIADEAADLDLGLSFYARMPRVVLSADALLPTTYRSTWAIAATVPNRSMMIFGRRRLHRARRLRLHGLKGHETHCHRHIYPLPFPHVLFLSLA